MPVSIENTVIRFNDGTTQSTAAGAGGVTSLNGQTGAITNTNLNAIGSYVVGRPTNATAYDRNSTLAGSSLWAVATGVWYASQWWSAQGNIGPQTLVNTGTWRCMSPAGGDGSAGMPGLWVRIS